MISKDFFLPSKFHMATDWLLYNMSVLKTLTSVYDQYFNYIVMFI